MEHVVGIGGYSISDNQEDIIKTFALSTCVGLVFYSIRRRVMGMAHVQMPNSRTINAQDAPSRFADTAADFLLREMMNKSGVTKGEILISLYGGVDSRGESDCFRIGEKNLQTVKETLNKLRLVYSDVDTGGYESRTLIAHVATGVVDVIKRPLLFRPAL